MKNTLVAMLASLLCIQALAQKPVDSLATDKREWIGQFLPAQWGRLTYGTYAMEPQELLSKLENFKKAAYDSTASEKDPFRRELKKKDIDAYARLMIKNYIYSYGIDSVKEAAFYAMLQKERDDDTMSQQQLEALSEARFVKKLPEAAVKRLDSIVLNGWEINDSALFYNSAAFRQLVEMKVAHLLEQQNNQAQNDMGQYLMLWQQTLDKTFGKGYVYEWMSYENMMNALTRGVDSGTLATLYTKYVASASNSAGKAQVQEFYKNATTYTANKPAPDFSYKDINGKMVSLKQLRGKYVYIDVWATWCGPCKGEIPHLVKLEKALHGKKIHFVSISVDKQKDKGAWEKYVREKNLKGIQLMVDKDFDSGFIKKLNVYSIPRFILIGPDGKIIDADAMRPSDKRLKTQLETLL